MKLVIDSNVVISALVKESVTREIILDSKYEFISPDYLISEIERHKELIKEKSGLSERNLEAVLHLLLGEVEILPREEYEFSLKEAENILGEVDPKDVPFLACGVAKNCPIWSDDKHFQQQDKAEVYTTEELKRKAD